MDVFMDLITYFGITTIGEAETFPELLQAFFFTLFAMYLVYLVIRAMFSMCWRINQQLTR